jgi:hypothetical protein
VTLADEEVFRLLQDRFVVGTRNNAGDAHVGQSGGYGSAQTSIGTSNGAGARNVQLVVMAADATVLQVLPGFWHPGDLARELRFALELHALWTDRALTRAEQQQRFTAMQRVHVRAFPDDTLARSSWQTFDRASELVRTRKEPRDTTVCESSGPGVFDGVLRVSLKPVCVLVHERMLAQPFRSFADFDMESFVDYAQPFYDLNMWVDAPVPLAGGPQEPASAMDRATAVRAR